MNEPSNSSSKPNGIPPRDGARETVNLSARFRDFFDGFVEAGYRTRGLEGIPGAAARRELADKLESARDLISDVVALLRAEAVDMAMGAKIITTKFRKKS